MTYEKRMAQLYVAAWALLLIIATPYIQKNNGGEGLALPFNTTTWIAVALIVTLGALQASAQLKLYFTRFNVLVYFTICALAAPLLWSDDPWRAYALDRYLAIFAMSFLILSRAQFSLSARHLNLLMVVLVIAGLVQSFTCIAQLFYGDHLSWYTGKRLVGTLQQPNLVGSFIGTTLVVAMYQYAKLAKNLPQKVLMLIALTIGTWALILVMSRTGAVGTATGIIGITLLTGWRSCLPAWAAIACGALLALTVLSTGNAETRANLSDPGYRITAYSLSTELLMEKPLTGYGIGRFQSVFMKKQAAEDAGYAGRVVALSHPHNELLFWGVEGGLLPVMALVSLGCWMSWQVWRHGQVHQKSMWIAALPILLHTQTELPLYLSTPHLALLSLLISEADSGKKNFVTIRNGSLLKRLAILLMCMVSIFMLTNLQAINMLNQAVHSPAALAKIINPLAQEKRINEILGEVLAQQKDAAALKEAEAIARQEILLRPTALSYQILVDALLAQERYGEAAVSLAEGQRFFPGFARLREQAKSLDELNKNPFE